jgi:ECF transporter S component (folate family)
MTLKEKIVNSAKELTNIYSLSALGMLLALRIILGIFANSTMAMFGNTIKISLNFLPIAVAAVMFGPVSAGLVGALGDVLSFFLNSAGTTYFPGFTINGFITGMIFGILLYKNNAKIQNVLIAWFINTVLVEVAMSGYWLYFIYGAGTNNSFLFYLWTRIISEAIKAVPTILLMYTFGKVCAKIPVPKRIHS